MGLNKDEIEKYISEIPFVKKIYSLEQGDFSINAKVEIAFDELDGTLDFEVEILPLYPLKSYGSESISFKNKELISFNHVMGNGSICIHTLHSTNLKQKLSIDFNSLKNWIVKYYINKGKDLNYEHIIVSESPINETYNAYIFTDVNRKFKKGEFGDVQISYLSNGIYKEKVILNFLVHSFKPVYEEPIKCEWSNIYANGKITHTGFYIFIEEVPAKHNRFIFQNWTAFIDFLPQKFLSILHQFEKENKTKRKGEIIPLFIGYRTIESNIHWQIAILEVGKIPLCGVPEEINGKKTGTWISELIDEKIIWSLSRNSSYKYFFGRGILSQKITEKRILIIGIGAIGSMVAVTLARGGCKHISFIDYDVKEPENVCRSEYFFLAGITNKTEELKIILSGISPFVNIHPLFNNYFETLIKIYHKEDNCKTKFVNEINEYDLIFDCTTDNDLMYVLNSLDLSSELINMSITNHAKELVCAFHPNIYQFVNNQFGNVLQNDEEDLYNPIGCWNPTFKATYNDINVLVQLALKHINILFEEESPKNNFVIKSDENNPSNLKVVKF